MCLPWSYRSITRISWFPTVKSIENFSCYETHTCAHLCSLAVFHKIVSSSLRHLILEVSGMKSRLRNIFTVFTETLYNCRGLLIDWNRSHPDGSYSFSYKRYKIYYVVMLLYMLVHDDVTHDDVTAVLINPRLGPFTPRVSGDTSRASLIKNNSVFIKWAELSLNSVNSWNLLNAWNMNWDQFEYSAPFTVMTNIFAEFGKTFRQTPLETLQNGVATHF